MKTIKHCVFSIIIGSSLLYFVVGYIPELGLQVSSEYKDIRAVFLVLGTIFYFTNIVLKNILNIITIPAKLLTFGLSSIIINIALFYFFEQFINFLDVGIEVTLGNIIQTTILSFLMTGIYLLIKKLS